MYSVIISKSLDHYIPRSKYFDNTIIVVESLQLHFRTRAKIDEYRNRPACASEVSERLVMLLFGQSGERLTLNNDKADWQLHHHIHLHVGVHGLPLVQWMVLKLLVSCEPCCDQLSIECLLIDIFRQTCAKQLIHLKDAADNAVGGLNQFVALGLRDNMYGFSILGYHIR